MNGELAGETILERVRGIWRRRWRMMTAVFVLLLTASLSVIKLLPPVFRASVDILVDLPNVPEEFVGRGVASTTMSSRVQAISQVLLSRTRLERVIAELNLFPETQLMEQRLERFRRNLRTEMTSEAGNRDRPMVSFSVAYQGNDARQVATVANRIATLYVDEYSTVRQRQVGEAAAFVEKELQDLRVRLDQQENRVSEFRKRHAGELPEQILTNAARVQQLTAELAVNSQAQLRLNERLENQRRQLAELTAPAVSPPVPVGLADDVPRPVRTMNPPESATAIRIGRLRQEIADLLSRYTERYPDVVQKRTEVALLEAQLAEERRQEEQRRSEEPAVAPATSMRPVPPPRPMDPNIPRLESANADTQAELRVLRGEENRLRTELALFQARIDRAPLIEQEFQRISRDLATTKELYQMRLRRTEDLQLADSIEQEQRGVRFRVLEEAVPPKEAAGPKRRLFALGALLLAFAGAAASALVAEAFDSSFHSVDDLREFSAVPILVSIPRLLTARDIRRGRWQLAVFLLALACGVVVIAGSAYALLGPRVPMTVTR